MTRQPRNERTSPAMQGQSGDDATRTERRRPPLRTPPLLPEWIRPVLRAGWIIIAVLFLFILAGADLAEWILSNGN